MSRDCQQMKEAIRERAKNRPRASRSPRPERSRSRKRPTSPTARDVFRQLKARLESEKEDRVKQTRLEECERQDEEERHEATERRTLWLEEEMRRTAMLEREERWCQRRREEDEAHRKKQQEEDQERRRLFRMEIEDAREAMQTMLQEAVQNVVGKS